MSIVHLIVYYVWEMNNEVVECFEYAMRKERAGFGPCFESHVYFALETARVMARFNDISSS